MLSFQREGDQAIAKFIQVQSTENHSSSINVETIKYVAQKQRPQFICDIFPIGESAASFISRVGAVAHTPDEFKL